ncbi:MAG TPA: histidine--tRNA ligase [Armatimonadota bacterium]
MADTNLKFQAPRGTHDVTPAEVGAWLRVEETFRRVCRLYRYGEIRTPLFESSEITHRSSGETSDIVTKETYDFTDRGGDSFTLRPEGTPGVIRAAIEHGLIADSPVVKLAYIAPMFRYDRPQKGRFRQHHQVGIEVLGPSDAASDAEVIALGCRLHAELGIKGAVLKINSVGSPEDRPVYRQALVDYFTPRAADLTEESRNRLATNPLRILDSKAPNDRELVAGAPRIQEYLTAENAAHFDAVKSHLDRLGIAFEVDPLLVRGLDYYTRTAFEWVHGGLGAQSSIGGGGRYNGLVEALGGPPTPGIGFGMGIERLMLAMEDSGVTPPVPDTADVYAVAAGDETRGEVFALCQECRDAGLAAEFDPLHRSVKSQMKSAGKAGAGVVLLIGGDELTNGTVTLRDMAVAEQHTVPRAEAVAAAKRIVEMRK